MSDEWIKMRCNLGHEPEVIQIAEMLDLDIDTVVGKLHRLWSWADQTCASGNVVGVTFVRVNWLVRQKGFAESLESVGWLVRTKSGVSFPKYDRHMSKNAKKRALTRRRAAMFRKREREREDNAPSVTNALPEQEQEKGKPSKSPLAAPRETSPDSGGEENFDGLPQVTASWKAKYPDCQLGQNDYARIKARLADGFTAEQLIAAIDRSPYMSIRKMFRDAGAVNAILNPPEPAKPASLNDDKRVRENERGKFIRWARSEGKDEDWIETTAKQRWPELS